MSTGKAANRHEAWPVVGRGEPLVVLPGLAKGPERGGLSYAGLARATGREIHVLNRPAGLPRGISMAELAGLQAGSLAARFPGPVDILGASTGGVIALQIAVDHPSRVRRLVVAAAASWLGEEGREKLRAYGCEVEAGRSGAAILASVIAPPNREWIARLLLRLASFLERKQSPGDMLATIDAEAAFDVTARLSAITAPALLIAGGRDRAFPLPLVQATAAGIPGSKLIVYPTAGHLGAMINRQFGADVARFLSAS